MKSKSRYKWVNIFLTAKHRVKGILNDIYSIIYSRYCTSSEKYQVKLNVVLLTFENKETIKIPHKR